VQFPDKQNTLFSLKSGCEGKIIESEIQVILRVVILIYRKGYYNLAIDKQKMQKDLITNFKPSNKTRIQNQSV